MVKHTRWIVPAVLAAAAFAFADDPTPAPEPAPAEPALAEQVRQAYRDTQQYQAAVDFALTQTQGRVTNIQKFDLYIAYDRPQQQLLVDKPDMRIVIDDGQMKMASPQAPRNHLDAAVNDPIEWQSMINTFSLVNDPPLPDMAMLVADDPAAALARGGVFTAGDAPGTLVVQTDLGPMTLTINPDTHLIDRAEVQIKGRGRDPIVATYSYDYHVQKHNEPLDADTFAFDATNSKPAATIAELQTNLQQTLAAAQSASQALISPESQALLNNDVPHLEIKTIDGKTYTLGETEQRVVILDFWGTWCMPCHMWLPKMQELQDWANEQGLSVLVIAVDTEDAPEDAIAFWKDAGYTMAMTLDEDQKLFNAFVPVGFPQTYIIVDGKLIQAHAGIIPGQTEVEVRNEVLKALKGGDGESSDEPQQPSKRAPGA